MIDSACALLPMIEDAYFFGRDSGGTSPATR